MKEKDWLKFKTISEEKFKTVTLQKYRGFQIQKDTKWNDGLSISEIEELEKHFGVKFPIDYVEMLKAFNGFKTLQISIDPNGKNQMNLTEDVIITLLIWKKPNG